MQGPFKEYRLDWQQLPIEEYQAISFLGQQEQLDLWDAGMNDRMAYNRWYMLGVTGKDLNRSKKPKMSKTWAETLPCFYCDVEYHVCLCLLQFSLYSQEGHAECWA